MRFVRRVAAVATCAGAACTHAPAASLGLLRIETMFTRAAASRVTIQRGGATSDLALRTRPLI